MKSFYEVESLIWRAPDELNEEEIENYLVVATVQTTLSRDNYLALVELDVFDNITDCHRPVEC